MIFNAGADVVWTLSPPVGKISSSGLYTAPVSIDSLQTVVLIATSVSHSRSGTATVTLLPSTATLSVTPSVVSLSAGQSASFSALVNGTADNGAVTWSLSPAIGSFSNGVYRAPSSIPSAETVTLTASAASLSKTASATISLLPAPTVTITPSSTTLSSGQTVSFSAKVAGLSNQGVNWSLSPNVGTMSNGLYTAPGNITIAQTVTLTATSVANSRATASVPISLVPSTSGGGTSNLQVSPTSVSLAAGQAAQFTITTTGDLSKSVSWSLSPNVGSISNGLYTAPSSVSAQTVVTVTATSLVYSSKTVSAAVTLMPSVSVSMTPSSISLSANQQAVFSTTVGGTSNTGVAWSISPSVGSISNGTYTAPASLTTSQTVTVTATSTADSTKSAHSTVSLSPISIALSPSTASLNAGGSTQFTASVSGSSNTSVNWSITPAVGSVSNGLYKAPASVSSAQNVTITATSAADSTKSASATIALVPVTISLSPSTASLNAGGSTQFTASVGGSSNTSVNWSITPAVGSISNGLYTAPASLSSTQSVTVIATSAADSTKSASAAITLSSIAITLSPSTATLNAGGSTQFTASVAGSGNTSVNWSITPAVGSISNGLYQAPASISSTQTVTVTATSATDSTKSASATITLAPVTVSLSPGTVSLNAGGSTQFTASVAGSSNTGVSWSVSPAIGSISNGLYQAPASVSSTQTVTVTATSVADGTKSAKAAITLSPVTIALTPTTASLSPGGSMQFSANVTGSSSTVNWSVTPAIGSISNGLYTAPSSVSSQQTVTITATDGGTSVSASLTLMPPLQTTTIKLPLEVVGPNGTTVAASFSVGSGANLSGPGTLSMQIHGLRFDQQASVQINNSGWLPISTGTVTLLGLANAYGGLGGGFHTLQMTMNLPAGVVQSGNNTITFRFNQTDGRVSGFRVLGFNITDTNGNQLISSSNFVWDDPNTWQPPSSLSSDISAGQALWQSAALTVPTTGGTKSIQARCADCHSSDGRDLKYFNYSNNSIQARSMFHGLTAQQGTQIASYIRSLNVPNPGRPWNPPYQPGPGLDSQPVQNWSAGAGISAVVDTDAEMMNAMFPNGISSSTFSANGVLNARETQLAMQLPDWNSWLPIIHPKDAFSDFMASMPNQRYQQLVAMLQPNSATSYANAAQTLSVWTGDYSNYMASKRVSGAGWTPTYVQEMYSLALWTMVKSWELNQIYGLEGMAKTVFTNPKAEARAWLTEFPFLASPNMLQIPVGAAGMDNGSVQTFEYIAFEWYMLQLILDDSEYNQQGNNPIDWGYVFAFISNMWSIDSPPQAALFTEWQIKGLQITNNGITPDQVGYGWSWFVADITRQTSPGWRGLWGQQSASTRAAIYNGLASMYLAEVQQFTPAQFQAGEIANGNSPLNYVPQRDIPDSGQWPDRLWYAIPRFAFWGVNQTTINGLISFAQQVWPNGGWSALASSTCSADPTDPTAVLCSTDH